LKKLLFSLILLSMLSLSVNAVTKESMALILIKTRVSTMFMMQAGFNISSVVINKANYKEEISDYRTFSAGTTYKFYGAGSDGILDLDISLVDDDGNIVAADTKKDNLPMVTYTPTKTQSLKIKVLPYSVENSCKYDKNLYSLVIGYK